MKKIFKSTLIAIFIMAAPVLLNAQTPPHPNNGSGAPGNGNTVVGGQQGGAPVGNGNMLLLGLAMLYAAKKLVDSRKEQSLS